VVGERGFTYNAGSHEFGAIRYTTAGKSHMVGDKLELSVRRRDPAVNENDSKAKRSGYASQ
jgi:hypothetical protein